MQTRLAGGNKISTAHALPSNLRRAVHHHERSTANFVIITSPILTMAARYQNRSELPRDAEPLTYLLQHLSPAISIATCTTTCAEKLTEAAGHGTAITSFPDETAALMDQRHPSSLTVSPLGHVTGPLQQTWRGGLASGCAAQPQRPAGVCVAVH